MNVKYKSIDVFSFVFLLLLSFPWLIYFPLYNIDF